MVHAIWLNYREDLNTCISDVFLDFNNFDIWSAITTIKKPGNFETRVDIIAVYVILERTNFTIE